MFANVLKHTKNNSRMYRENTLLTDSPILKIFIDKSLFFYTNALVGPKDGLILKMEMIHIFNKSVGK